MTEDATKRPGTVHRQKARRAHDCAECADPIVKGQSYIYLNTFDRGTWSRYVLCQACERILNCHRIAELALDATLAYGSGTMRREVKGFIRSGTRYRVAFQEAWAASEPPAEVETESA